MDRDEKVRMLLDMQEHPEEFSEEQLEQMLADGEARELMEATAQLKQAMMMAQKGERRGVTSLFASFTSPLKKTAAMFIGVLLVSGIAFAAIWMQTRPQPLSGSHPTEEASSSVPHSEEQGARVESGGLKVEPVVFDNVALDTMLTDIATYYDATVDYRNEAVRQLRFHFVWKREEGLHRAIEKLNRFESLSVRLDGSKIIVE